ncbi:U2 small nuclear ribonucleoprotein B'' [Cichlidogyrus casuarinus]|uniref:U2 small nuclear ribonucleoprotein B n=1 Tax=Cichlidogyrus casuarinus TaxID=1844966 RepID=A0ABD2QB04_9PLAT
MVDIKPSQTLYINNLNEKIKKHDLKKGLYYLFCPYGRMLDIIAMKTIKMRGQAFVIFADTASATTALKMLQGFVFFQKPLRIQYSRKESTQVTRDKGAGQTSEMLRKKEEERERRRKKKLAQKVQMAVAAPAPPPTEQGTDNARPNNVLFVQNLPDEATDAMLTMLFNQFSGFVEARKATGGVAFIEYENEAQATAAQTAYHGFKLTPSHALQVSYAKK